jgi:linoleoyl-CoA desaturase
MGYTSVQTRFNNNLHKDFSKALNKRVSDYFKNKGIGRHANLEMVVKTIVMFTLYFGPYGIILSGAVTSVWAFIGLQIVVGIGLAGIGLAVMHDANHGAYSQNRVINEIIGYSLDLIGANRTNWKIQHNIKHHTYTNIHGHDEDISPKGGIIRLSPNSDKKPIHKYQYVYAWFLYGLMTISWMVVKDIKQLLQYSKEGLVQKVHSPKKAWVMMVGTKIFYATYILALPMILSPYSWWMILIGFMIMHYVAGFILAVIFQPAHVIEGNDFPTVNEHQIVDENWSVHQLRTTCNFAPRNRLLSWYVGGLNYQIEHHLFPNICHVHYRKIAQIVRKTANEFNVPYKSYDTFWSALCSHGRMLYVLGR